MKKWAICLFGMLGLLVPTVGLAQAYTPAAGTTVQNGHGVPLAGGTFCAVPYNSAGAVTAVTPSGGSPSTGPFCSSITAGAFTASNIPNLATAAPSGLNYLLTVFDASSNVVMAWYGVQVSGASWSFDTYVLAPPILAQWNSAIGIGAPYPACSAGATWYRTDTSTNPGWQCKVAVSGYTQWTQSGSVSPTPGPGNSATIPVVAQMIADALAGGGGGGAVSSVFTRTGHVAAQTGDYSFAQISGVVGSGQLPVLTAAEIAAAGNLSNQTATAVALAAVPAQCSGSTPVATGIQANGNANCTTGGGGTIIPSPQYSILNQPNTGTVSVAGPTQVTTDSTGNQLNAPITSGRYDAFKWQTTPTSNNGIANGIAAASTGGRTVAGPNYSAVENAVFPATQSALFDDQRAGRGDEWYHNTASQYAKNVHCLFDQRLAGNPYSTAGCNYTYLDALGTGSDEGGGVLPVAATRAVYNNSYMMGIQTDGDVYLNCFHNDDCHENTTYLQFVGENLDPDQEGIQLHGANVTEAQHVFTGTIASVTDSQHLRMTPAYGQEFAGTELVKTSATLDTGLVTALANTVGYAPLTFTSSVTHTASAGWGTFAAASPQPADPVNGSMETIVVNVLGGAFPTSGPVCIDSVGHYWFQESTASATTLSGGQQTLTMPLRYPFFVNTFIVAGSCTYERNTADLQTDGGGITSDPMAIIVGAPNTTDYWYYIPNGGGLMGVNGGLADGAAALPFSVTSLGSTTRNTSNLVTLTAPVSSGGYTPNAYFVSSPSISVSSCSDTSLNFSAHAVAVTLGTDGATLTFTQPSGPGTSTTATGCVITASGLNGYTISPGARALSVSDPSVVVGYDASAAVNGYYLLDRNTAFSTGDVGATGEQPHAARLGVNTNSEYLVQQTPSYGGFASRMFNLHVAGRGGSAPGTTPFTLVNDTPWASYLGGGGLNTPGTPFQITGVWSGWGHFTAPANGGTWAQLDCPPNGCSQNFPYQVLGLGGDAGAALRFTPHTGYLEWGQQFGAIGGFAVPFSGYGSTNAYSMYTNFAPDQGQGVLWKTYGFTSGGGSGVDGYTDGIARDSATLDYGNIVRRYFDVAGISGHALKIDSGLQQIVATIPIASTVTTGTAPFAVASTTQVANLNVSQIGGVALSGLCQTGGAGCPGTSTAPANTIYGNFTSSTAAPAWNAIASCVGANNALNFTAGTGFSCNSAITATTALSSITSGTATNFGGGSLGTIPYQNAASTTLQLSAPTTNGSYMLTENPVAGAAVAPVFTPFVLAGSGAGLVTGPTAVTTLHMPEYIGTTGQQQDSGIAVAAICLNGHQNCPLATHQDYWNIASALFATSTAVGPVYFEMDNNSTAGTLKLVTARLSGTISCTVAPSVVILDLGTSATTAYGSATVLTTLATGTSDGAYVSSTLTVAVTSGHYLGVGFSAGTCVTAPVIDVVAAIYQ